MKRAARTGTGTGMPLFRSRLHASVIRTADDAVKAQGALARNGPQRAASRDAALAAAPGSYDIKLSTISRDRAFDALIDVQVRGANTPPMSLVVDTGNTFPILPSWAAIAAIPNWQATYAILKEGPDVAEPWGAPAKLVRGPLELTARNGSVFAMENCVFYACTGNVPGDTAPTANFGAGCLTRYDAPDGWPLRPAQTYNPAYPYAEFDFASDSSVLSLSSTLRVQTDSTLRISKQPPGGYAMFDIVPQCAWMALRPRALSVGATQTQWPRPGATAIAMIDTGGDCIFLSDPDAYVYNADWPDPVRSPDWIVDSICCQSTELPITLELGDKAHSFTYTLDTSGQPAAVQGRTLVMCKTNSYMRGQYGLNTGGVSALAIGILVDYANNRVGLKLK